jgi:hypothetical protein
MAVLSRAIVPGSLTAVEQRKIAGKDNPVIVEVGANSGQTTVELLREMPGERKSGYRIKAAKFTLRPAFEDIDFTASRSISKAQIKEIYGLQCLTEGRPVLLIGQTGVGKTFIAGYRQRTLPALPRQTSPTPASSSLTTWK